MEKEYSTERCFIWTSSTKVNGIEREGSAQLIKYTEGDNNNNNNKTTHNPLL